MTVITAVQKGDQIAIACDTQTTAGWLKCTAEHIVDHSKLVTYGDSIFGLTGAVAIRQIFEDLLVQTESNPLASRLEIFRWLLSHQKTLKEDYYINTKVGTDKEQPVDSTWANALIANPYGIFGISRYRSVFEYSKFWAIGSGGALALGAMDILYEQDLTAAEIAEAGAVTATKFNMGCSPPIRVKTMQKATEPPPKPKATRKTSSRKTGTTKASTQKASTTKTSTQKASAAKTGTRKASTAKASATKASTQKASTRKASTTKTGTTKTGTRKATTAKASTTKASATKASTAKASTRKASTTKASATKASTRKASTSKTTPRKTTARKATAPKSTKKASTTRKTTTRKKKA